MRRGYVSSPKRARGLARTSISAAGLARRPRLGATAPTRPPLPRSRSTITGKVRGVSDVVGVLASTFLSPRNTGASRYFCPPRECRAKARACRPMISRGRAGAEGKRILAIRTWKACPTGRAATRNRGSVGHGGGLRGANRKARPAIPTLRKIQRDTSAGHAIRSFPTSCNARTHVSKRTREENFGSRT